MNNIFIRGWRNFISYFPSSRQTWKSFSKVAIPIVVSSILVSINGFIDNFMVTGTKGGPAALGYANSFTGITMAVLLGIGFVGAVLFGQYYGKKEVKHVKEVIRLRYLLSLIWVILFSAIFWIFAEQIMKTIIKGSGSAYEEVLNAAIAYVRIIAISWVLMGITYTSASLLRESGYGSFSLYIALASLATNVILNLILIPRFGVVGSAWATVCSQFVILIGIQIFTILKNKTLLINYLTLWKISPQIWKQFLKRTPGLVFTSLGLIFTSIRTPLWSIAYPIGSLGYGEEVIFTQWGIGAAAVLGITASMTQIFTAAFPSIQANVTIFVGSHLGKGEVEIAQRHAKELKGFHTLISIVLSLIFGVAIILTPFFHFFTGSVLIYVEKGLISLKDNPEVSSEIKDMINLEFIKTQQELAAAFYLKQIQLTCISIAIFNPIWTFFITSLRSVSAGGKNNITSYLEFGMGLIQTIWLLIIVYAIIPNSNVSKDISLPLFYFSFFLSDFLKLSAYEIAYRKIDWAKNITTEIKS